MIENHGAFTLHVRPEAATGQGFVTLDRPGCEPKAYTLKPGERLELSASPAGALCVTVRRGKGRASLRLIARG